MWDFSTEPEFQTKLDWVEAFCREEVEPLELIFPYAVWMRDPKMKALVDPLKEKVKEQGLWAIFLDKELGGPGFGQLKLALVNEIIGRYSSAPSIFGCQAPDTGNMELLAAYGTDEQKQRWLYPLMRQEIWSAYSMTEPEGGSDPDLFKTTAVRDGEEWVINGEKWFSSNASHADIIFVMCTNGIFVVPADTPGVEMMEYPRTHNHVCYRDVRVPLDHLLGPENSAKVLAQRRLGGGRIHHAMRAIAQCRRAFDMMCERALSRQSHGKVIAEHQLVQSAIADSYAEINMLRLLVLWTAWTIDNSSTREARTQIAACKFTAAKVLREVAYRAIHIFGSLGVTDLTPLQAMWASSPTMSVMDGVDEVHKVTVARDVLKEYSPHEGLWPTEYLPAKREQAQKKFNDAFAADPDLVKYSERMLRRALGTDMANELLNIGAAAAKAGVTERALRYYHELGLVEPSAVTPGGMRRYSEEALARVARIRELQDLIGLNLDEIAVVLRNEDRVAEIRAAYEGLGPAERQRLLLESLQATTEMRCTVETKRAALDEFLSDLDARIARIRSALDDVADSVPPPPGQGVGSGG